MYGYVEYDDIAFNNERFYTFSEVAKMINKKKFGRNNLLKFLRKKGILNKSNIAREDLIKDGYFRVNFKSLYPGACVNSSGVSKKGISLIKSLLP